MGDTSSDRAARAVANHVLEETRVAYLTGDYARFKACCHLPQLIGSFDGDRVISEDAELRAIFDRMTAFFGTEEVVDLHRTLIVAEFRGPDAVEATFVSKYLFKSGQLGEETYAHGVLRRIDGTWKIAESRYASTYQAVTDVLIGKEPGDR
ncbi:MAG: hypothetical protein AAF092_11150 [Pseudomonadota bacterium]